MIIKLKGLELLQTSGFLLTGLFTLLIPVFLFFEYINPDKKRTLITVTFAIFFAALFGLLTLNTKKISETLILKIEKGILTIASINLLNHLNKQTIDLNKVKEVKKKTYYALVGRYFVKKNSIHFINIDNSMIKVDYYLFDIDSLHELIKELKTNYKEISIDSSL